MWDPKPSLKMHLSFHPLRHTLAVLVVTLHSLTLAVAADQGSASLDRPNIIVIMADDLGYETVSANGGTPYQTPALDRLAAEGIRFSNCVAQPLCTPSRVKIMTGRFNIRNYGEFGILDPRETTFGQVLRRAGYATCIAGKWQLGKDRKLIDHFGFDEYCLWWLERKSKRYNNVGELIKNGTILPGNKGEYGPDVINQFVMDFIQRHRSTPFFCYYPMILTHSPFDPTPDTANEPHETKSNLDRMSDMVTYTDKLIGRLVDHLERLELRENTVILFTGDNGTGRPIQGSKVGDIDWPGGKGSNFLEMGMRVPFIASFPRGGVRGKVVDDPVDLADFFPTVMDLAGAELPSEPRIDGHSFMGRLTGQPDYRPHPWAYVAYYGRKRGKMSHFARDKRYKLYEGGYFYDFTLDPWHRNPIDPQTATDEVKISYDRLSKVLEEMKSQIPAGDAYMGKRSEVVSTRPGPHHLKKE